MMDWWLVNELFKEIVNSIGLCDKLVNGSLASQEKFSLCYVFLINWWIGYELFQINFQFF